MEHIMPTFSCKKCLFYTERKSHWKRHILTGKHINDDYVNGESIHKCSNTNPYHKFKCGCGKEYKFNTGLAKHKTKCVFLLRQEHTNTLNNIIPTLLTEVKEILNIQKNIAEKQEIALTTPNIINNNKVSINFYLNETCKNAMNLREFIENLKISLDDLTYTTNHGYVKGISNIFVKQLKGMSPTHRPIHCSDNKRLKFYVKEDDKWDKDEKHIKIDKSIDELAHRQLTMIKKWEEEHKDYKNSNILLLEWHKMVKGVMEGLDIDKKQKNSDLIKKNIGTSIKLLPKH